MALNFLGLGFSFGVKDSGLEDTQRSILSNFESMSARMIELGQAADKASVGDIATSGQVDQINKMNEAMDGLEAHFGKELPEASRKGTEQFHRDSAQMESDQRKIGGGYNLIRDSLEKLDTIARQNKLQTFIQAISLSRLNGIADGIGEITSSGQNLTTSFEAEMISLSKSTRSAGANFGYTGKALSKFSGQTASMAKSLNIDANTAALALRGWHEAGDELAAMGFRSAKEVAKFSEAFGVSADVLRNSGLRMRNEFNMTDKQINKVVGSFTKMGQHTGDVKGALGELPKIMGMLRRKSALMNKSLDPETLANYAAGTAAVASAYMSMGQDSDVARAGAVALAEKMLESEEGFKGLFAGVGDDISEFFKAVGIGSGDLGKAFQSMQQSPDEFMAGMAQMTIQARDMGKSVDLSVLRGQLAGVFGPEQAAQMVNFFKKAKTADLELMAAVKKSPAELGKLAKETHRTGRTMAESFELTKDVFIASFRKISKKEARIFVKETGAEFKKFNKQLLEISKDDGPLGSMVTKFSEMHQLGSMALIPKTLRPMAAVLGGMVGEMTPIVTALGAMGFRLTALLNPFFLLATAIGGAVVWFSKLRMEGKTSEEALTTMGETIKEKFSNIVVFVGKQVEKLKGFVPHVTNFVTGMWQALIGGVDPKKGGKDQATAWGVKLGAAVRAGSVVAVKEVKGYFSDWWEKLGTTWSDKSKSFTDKIKDTVGGSAGVILGAFALTRFTPIFGVIGKLTSMLGPLGKAMNMLVPGPLKIVAGLGGLIVLLDKYPEKVNKVLDNIGAYFQVFLDHFTTLAVKIGTTLVRAVVNVAPQIPMILAGMFSAAVKAVLGILDKLKQSLQREFPRWFKAIEVGFETLKVVAVGAIVAVTTKWIWGTGVWIKRQALVAATAVAHAARTTAVWVAANTAMVAGVVKTAAVFVAKAAIMGVSMAAAAIPVMIAWAPFIALAAAIGAAVYGVIAHWDKIKAFFVNLWDSVVNVTAGVWDTLTSILFRVPTALQGLWSTVASFFSDLWEGVKSTTYSFWDGILSFIISPITTIRELWGSLTGFFSDLWGTLKKGAGDAWNWIADKAMAVPNAIGGAWGGVAGFFGNVWGSVKGTASKAWSGIKDGASNLWGGITGFFKGGSSEASNTMEKAMEGVRLKSLSTHKSMVKDAEIHAPKVSDAHARAATMSEKVAEQHAKAIKIHTEAVSTQVQKANALSYGKLITEEGQAWKKWFKMAEDAENLTGEARAQASMEVNKFHSDMKKQFGSSFGRTGYFFNQLEKRAGRATEAFKTHKKELLAQQEALKGVETAAAKAESIKLTNKLAVVNMIDRERRTSRDAAEARITELAKMMDAEKITNEQFEKMGKAAVESAVVQKDSFSRLIQYATGTVKLYEMNTSELGKHAQNFAIYQASLFTKSAQDATLTLAGLSTTQRDKLSEISKAASAAFRSDVADMVSSGKLQGAELEASVEASKNKHFDLLTSVKDAYAQYGGDIGAASSAQFQGVLESVDKRAQELVDTTKSKADEFATGVQETFKLSGQEAAHMVEEIANISPEKFKENIAVVKTEMVALLVAMKDINNGVVALGPNAEKAFPQAKKAMDKFSAEWDKKFSGTDSISAMADRQFKAIKDSAVKLTTELPFVLEGMWVRILKMTDLAVQAIGADTKGLIGQLKTVANVSGISSGTESSSVADVKPVKSFKSIHSKDEALYNATHWPSWYTEKAHHVLSEIAMNTREISNNSASTESRGTSSGSLSSRRGLRRSTNNSVGYGGSWTGGR